MIQWILSIFGLGNKLTQIQSQSDGALAQFKETLHKLKDTANSIAEHHKVWDAAIAKANTIKQSLNDIALSNSKVIAKLEEFLS